MSTLVIKRRDGSDLPRGTRVRVVTHPQGLRTWKGVVSRSANVELDPGCYRYAIHKSTKGVGGKFTCWKEVETIYHDITPEQHTKLLSRGTRNIRAIITTQGNRWRCDAPGCDVTDLTSPTAGLIHELEDHQGEKPLASKPTPPPVVDRPVVMAPKEPVAEKPRKKRKYTKRFTSPRKKADIPKE